MPTDLLSVTEIAEDFLTKSGYPFARLEKTYFDEPGRRWVLTFDVSLANPRLKDVVIGSDTGKVISFE